MKRLLPILTSLVLLSRIASAVSAPKTPRQSDTDKTSNPAGAAIPAGPDVHTGVYFRELCSKWWLKNVVDEYSKTPKADPKVAELMKKLVAYMYTTVIVYPMREQLEGQASQFIASGVDDPAFLYLAGVVTSNPSSQNELFTKALDGLPKSPYPKFLQFMASAYLGYNLNNSKADADAIKQRDTQSLDLLKASLAGDTLAEEDVTPLFWRYTAKPVSDLFLRKTGDMYGIMASSKFTLPVAHYLMGFKYDNIAWEIRGHEYSDKVTPEQWKGYRENIALAREHLVKSWELDSSNPMTPTEMITIAMCENEETDTMRTWFDRAVAIDMDYDPAYNAMNHGLLPEWLGSHDQMLHFGEECLATKRYDTVVPYKYAFIVRRISEDSKDPNEIFADPKVYKNLQDLFAAYIASDKSPIPAKYLHTVAALIAFKNGKLDEARKHLEAINYDTAKAADWAKVQSVHDMVKKLKEQPPQ